MSDLSNWLLSTNRYSFFLCFGTKKLYDVVVVVVLLLFFFFNWFLPHVVLLLLGALFVCLFV